MKLFLKIFIHISNFLSMFDEKLKEWELNIYASNFITGLLLLLYYAINNVYFSIYREDIINVKNYLVLFIVSFGILFNSIILLLIKLNRKKIYEIRKTYKDNNLINISKIKGIIITFLVIILFSISLYLITLNK